MATALWHFSELWFTGGSDVLLVRGQAGHQHPSESIVVSGVFVEFPVGRRVPGGLPKYWPQVAPPFQNFSGSCKLHLGLRVP